MSFNAINRKQRGALLPIVLALLLGVALGYGIALLQLGVAPTAPQAVTPRPITRASTAQWAPVDAAVPVRVGAYVDPPISGLLIGSDNWLVLPVAALLGANQATFRAGESELPATAVVAVLPSAGLVALRTPAGTPAGFALSPEVSNLQIGREMRVISAGASALSGWVDSPAQQDQNGEYTYAVQTDGLSPQPLAALLDDGHQLLGVAVAGPAADADSGQMQAYDVEAVQRLLATRSRMREQSIAEFARTFFTQTSEGLLIALTAAAAAGEHQQVIRIAPQIIDLSWQMRERVSPLLELAYVEVAGQALARADQARAGQLLNDAAAVLEWSPERRLLAARLAADQGELEQALEQLQRVAIDQPHLAEQMRRYRRELISSALDGERLTGEQAIGLLSREVRSDRDFAPWYAWLGLLQHEAGRYPQAFEAMQRARGLDPSLENELGPLMASAGQRLRTPGLTVVPVLSNGNSLYVHTAIEGSARQLRFLLDTGASYTAISPQLAQEIGLDLRRGQTVMLSTANGLVSAPLLAVPSLRLGDAVVNNVEVVVLDSLSRYDGLLGLSFLNHFNMDLDRGLNELTLVRR